MNLFPAGLGRIRPASFALLWGGNLLLLLLGFAWLQIPDSHAWEFALSMLSALILVGAFCWLQVEIFARLRAPGARGSLGARILGFAVVFAIGFFLAQGIASGDNGIPRLADYWNSQLSPGHRVVFTPDRIASILGWALLLAQFVLAAILIPIAMELGTRGFRRIHFAEMLRPWKRWAFWLVVIVAGIVGIEATTALVNWVSGQSLGMQTFSVLARLLVAWTLDALLALAALAMAAAAMDETKLVPGEMTAEAS